MVGSIWWVGFPHLQPSVAKLFLQTAELRGADACEAWSLLEALSEPEELDELLQRMSVPETLGWFLGSDELSYSGVTWCGQMVDRNQHLIDDQAESTLVSHCVCRGWRRCVCMDRFDWIRLD